MFNTNDCCKEKAVGKAGESILLSNVVNLGYLFPITEPCVDLSSYPDDTTSKRSEDITAQNIVDELESGTLQCDGDKFCEILQKNYDEPVNVECVKKDRSSLVVISMVVLIISLLISAIVGVIYRCQTEKRGLQQKHKQNTKKTNNELPNDQARLIASPSIASPTQSDACLPTKPSYDTFE